MAVGWHRPTKLVIDTQAIKENVCNEVKRMPEGTELFAVVKANGYGHGAVQTAQAAIKGGATGFCVALLDEAVELREAGITEPILILSVVDVSYIDLLLKYDLSVTVATQEWLEQAIDQLNHIETQTPLKIHIKVDTGMGRIGFTTPEAVKQVVELVQSTQFFIWEGLFTHFSTADEKNGCYFEKQTQRFQAILSVLIELPKYVHVSNSATALWHPDNVGNMIRFGIAMYGLNPSGRALPEVYPLKPALSLFSSLIQVKQLSAGEGIGYGNTYTTTEKEWIGTVPIGYADGWLRHLQGFSVLVNGKKCEIVGRICMDQCMIRLPKKTAVGTQVTLIGHDHGEQITMQMVADKLETIHYEVACTFSERMPREYK
ncbi:alanine racemase [Enterococcus haemoperoxidus ATCC BAA-382]|uniref:Alanine racemase n=1 Tax=Enterococcus haemoperoxidus ATCC BAA-382 TaxID=1158608 RepID=R2QFK2_9ENTE|nr:alanine racemase [Enterococcus haemoperoxidus]EOH94008.1 alanine racemase [Enterococcus haemoperoxidus ATCC BAA-382]EOT63316.1 alanine racemase [Enterococcus haemoperoxidus ATCC BAA-382]OJG54016.1 alanine racemase [Enterococcus haemoperoxidus]